MKDNQNQSKTKAQARLYYPFAVFTIETASVIISANSVIGFGIDEDGSIVWADDWTIELVQWNLSLTA